MKITNLFGLKNSDGYLVYYAESKEDVLSCKWYEDEKLVLLSLVDREVIKISKRLGKAIEDGDPQMIADLWLQLKPYLYKGKSK